MKGKKLLKNHRASGFKQNSYLESETQRLKEKLFQEKLFSCGLKQEVVQNLKSSGWKQKTQKKVFKSG